MAAASRARITAGELVVVCSHFELGVIEEIRRFRGGSRVAPKVFIKTSTGEYLLKRRGPGPSSEPTKVAFSHEVVAHLSEQGFPVPSLIGTRSGNNSMLQLPGSSPGGGGIYELFRFVHGERYDRTPETAWAAGWWLSRCHAMMRGYRPLFPAPRRTFHAHPRVPERLGSISGELADPGLRQVTRALAEEYSEAAKRASDRTPSGAAVEQIVHGDWHPGNMLFHSAQLATAASGNVPTAAGRVAAVFDFDSARMGQTLHDLANGAMQFSVQRHIGETASGVGIPASNWRIGLDPNLFAAFCAGYRAAPGGVGILDAQAWSAVPWLMIEALIVEACVPIAQTGKFGKLDAKPVLGVVHRAAEGMARQADELVALATRS